MESGIVIGESTAYVSPEQLCNLESLDGRADVLRLGVIMYDWRTGSCPYPPSSNYAEIIRSSVKTMKPLRQLQPDLGNALCDVIQRARAGARRSLRNAARTQHDLITKAAWAGS